MGGAFLVCRFAALAAGFAGLFGAEFVRGSLRVRGLTALAGDLALLYLIHGTEAPLAACWHLFASFQPDVIPGSAAGNQPRPRAASAAINLADKPGRLSRRRNVGPRPDLPRKPGEGTNAPGG